MIIIPLCPCIFYIFFTEKKLICFHAYPVNAKRNRQGKLRCRYELQKKGEINLGEIIKDGHLRARNKSLLGASEVIANLYL